MTYLDRSNPIRQMLECAALGRQPSKSQLDALKRDDLADGDDLHRFRRSVADACREVAALHGGESGTSVNYQDSRARADEWVSHLAQQMTPGERAVSGEEHPESLEAIGQRMFSR